MTGRTFFTADQHFGHRNIIDFCDRPFKDVDHMNEMLITLWNDTVAPDDTVFVLGDFAMGKIDTTLKIVGRLNGTKVLVPGNHDRCWTPLHKAGEWQDRYLEAGFHLVMNTTPGEALIVAGTQFAASHFPYAGDSGDEDRYTDWRPRDEGDYLLHGHVHTAWKKNGRQINVGVDVWGYRPVPLETLEEMV